MAEKPLFPCIKPAAGPADSTEKHWFAVYTNCRHEKRVAAHFESRAIEHYVPLYRAHHRWKDGSRATLDLPLFPCYVFARIARQQRISVLETPGVLWIVGRSGSQPTPLQEFEVETLRTALDPMRVEPHPLLMAGQRVRIREGALAGLEGIVVRRNNGYRVVITLELIMQSVAVEVNAEDLELMRSTAVVPAGMHSSLCGRPRELPFCEA